MTVQDLIKRALRMIEAADPAVNIPAAEASTGLEAVQSVYDHLATTEAFGPLKDVLIYAAYEAKENERVISVGGPFTVTFPSTITQPDLIVRAPKDRALIEVADTSKRYVYDASSASWVEITDLTLASAVPLGSRYGLGLAALTAMMISSEYGKEPPAMVQEMARRGRRAITRKDPIAADPVATELLRTSNRLEFWT